MKKFLLKFAFIVLFAAIGYLSWQNRLLHGKLAHRPDSPASTPVAKPDSQDETRRAIEQQTSELRGLQFKHSVRYKEMPRAQLREYLVGKVREQYTPQELHNYERSLAAFGLLPEGTDLLDAIISMYDEQVAAFYVPEERALYTFQEQVWSSNIDRMLLSHELTHALQDQNYDLTKFPLKDKNNDDLVLATSALIEGDATVLMTRWYVENAGPDKMLTDLASMLRQNTAKLLAAPEYLRAMLLFPYQEGQQFVTALTVAGGTKALDEAFRHPPTSTHEILHPDKFLHDRHEPVPVEVPAVATNEWRLIGNNVLGEFGIRSMLQQQLSPWQSQLIAQGSSGDRYHIYERATNGPTGLVWTSAWASEQEAIDFADAYAKLGQNRAAGAPLRVKVARDGARVTVWQSADTNFFDSVATAVEK